MVGSQNKFAKAACTAHKGKTIAGATGLPPKWAHHFEEILMLPPPPPLPTKKESALFSLSLLQGVPLQQSLSMLNCQSRMLVSNPSGLVASNTWRWRSLERPLFLRNLVCQSL